MIALADIEAAAAALHGHVRETPVWPLRVPSPGLDHDVLLKCENLQRTGSFKFRGAYAAISRLDAAARARGVVAYSSGNHAQAIALAASLLGTSATIVMPTDAPATKRAATLGYGARIVDYDRAGEDLVAIGSALAAEHGLTVIPPYDHPEIIAGRAPRPVSCTRKCRASTSSSPASVAVACCRARRADPHAMRALRARMS